MDYKIANASNPKMGLNNKVCENPKYWCRLHQVWLSEKDVEKKHCKSKSDLYMIENRRCTNLVRKDFEGLKAGASNGTNNQ